MAQMPQFTIRAPLDIQPLIRDVGIRIRDNPEFAHQVRALVDHCSAASAPALVAAPASAPTDPAIHQYPGRISSLELELARVISWLSRIELEHRAILAKTRSFV